MDDQKNNYISLQEATEFCVYSQEYLSLRARNGKLKAVKIGRNWVTTQEWLKEYLLKAGSYKEAVKVKQEAIKSGIKKPETVFELQEQMLAKTRPIEPKPVVKPEPVMPLEPVIPYRIEKPVEIELKKPAIPVPKEPVSPLPENLPVVEEFLVTPKIVIAEKFTQFVNSLGNFILPLKLRPAFVTALAFVLIVAGVVNGKSSLFNFVDGISPAVSEISSAFDGDASDFVKKIETGGEVVFETANNLARAGDKIVLIPGKLIFRLSKEIVLVPADAVRSVRNVFSQTGKRISGLLANLSTGIKESGNDIEKGLTEQSQKYIEKKSLFERMDERGSKRAKWVLESFGNVGRDIAFSIKLISVTGDSFFKEPLSSFNIVTEDISNNFQNLNKVGNFTARAIFNALTDSSSAFEEFNQWFNQNVRGFFVQLGENFSRKSRDTFAKIKEGFLGLNEGADEVAGSLNKSVIKISKISDTTLRETKNHLAKTISFFIRPWKYLPERIFVEGVPGEKIRELEQQIYQLQQRGFTVKEIIKEISEITKLEPIKEITREYVKEIVKIDEEELGKIKKRLVDVETRASNSFYLPPMSSVNMSPAIPTMSVPGGSVSLSAPEILAFASRDIEITGNLKVKNGNFTVNGGSIFLVDISGNLSTAGNISATGNLTVGGDLTVAGSQNYSGAAAFTANSTSPALRVTQSGTGKIVEFKDSDTIVFDISDGGQITSLVTATLASATDKAFYFKGPGTNSTAGTLFYLENEDADVIPLYILSSTNGPALQLTDSGALTLSNTTNGTGSLTIYDAAGKNWSIGTTAGTLSYTGDAVLQSGGNLTIQGDGVGADNLTIQQFSNVAIMNANVGIGIASPTSKLSVAGGASIGSSYAAVTPPTDGLLVEGNVGIGTTSPSAKLSVVGSISATGTVSAADLSATGSLVVDNGTLYVDSGNNRVGIGTTSPNYELEVVGDIYASGTIVGTGGVTPGGNIIMADDEYIGLGSGAGRIIFDNQSTDDISIMNANVGIGTQTPFNALSVVGGIDATTTVSAAQFEASNYLYSAGEVSAAAFRRGTDYITDFTGTGIVLSLGALTMDPDASISAGTNISWSGGDTLNVDDSFLLNTGDTGTGTYDFSGATLTGYTLSGSITGSGSPNISGLGTVSAANLQATADIYAPMIRGTNITDGTLSISSGNLTTTGNLSANNMTASGTLTAGAFSFSGNLTMGDDTWLGLGASDGRILFDNQSTDYISLMSGNFGIGTATPSQTLHVEGQCVTGDTLLPIISEQEFSIFNFQFSINDQFSIFKHLETKPIKDVQEGDYVLSLNEETKKIEPHRINGLLDMGVQPVYKLTTESGKTIRTTGNHPYLARRVSGFGGQAIQNKKSANMTDSSEFQYDTINLGLAPNNSIANPECLSTKKSAYLSGSWETAQSAVVPDCHPNNIISNQECLSSVNNQKRAVDGTGLAPVDSWVIIRNQHCAPPTAPSLYQDELQEAKFTPLDGGSAYLTGWTKVIYLQPGDEIAVAAEGGITPDVEELAAEPPRETSGVDIMFEQITSIEFVGYEQVYDIEVEDTHNFVANGIIAHNTYINSSLANSLLVENNGVYNNIFSVNGSTGNVGIGTTAPSNALSVVGGISSTTTVSAADLDATSSLRIGSSSVYNKVQTTGAGDLIVTSNLGQMLKTDSVNQNVLLGQQAGGTTYEGVGSTFIGYQAGYLNTSGAGDQGKFNTYVGYGAGYGTTNNTGMYNSALGYLALRYNTNGWGNSAMGVNTLRSNTTGNYNSAMGYGALYYTKTGSYNTAIGQYAGFGVSNNSFSRNSLFGYAAGYALSTGINNILLGYQAGDAITTGNNNLIIGYDIDAPSATGSNQMSIGNLIFGTGIDGTGTTISTGNVGIGTTGPSNKLSVVGGIDSTTTVSAADLDATSFIRSPKLIGGTATTSDLYLQTTSGVGAAGADMHFLVGNNGGTEAMTLLNSGYVGIGTTAPGAKLEISREVASETDGLRISNALVGGYGSLISFYSRQNFGSNLAKEAGRIQVQGESNWSSDAASDSYMHFDVIQDGTLSEKIRIKSSGNVGIGTTTPTSILHTVASGAKTDDYIGNLLTNTATSSTASKTKTGLSVLSTGTWNGTTAVNRGLYINATGGTTNYSAIFEGGNVGIGTSTPSNALSVVGGIDSTTTVSAADLDATSYLKAARAGITGDFTVDTNTLFVDSANNRVGIGTTAPSQLLHLDRNQNSWTVVKTENQNADGNVLAGFAAYNDTTTGYGIFGVGGTGYSVLPALQDRAFIVAGPNLTGINIYNEGANPIIFTIGNAEKVRINSNGNVGIGTTSPTNTLSVVGGISSTTTVSSADLDATTSLRIGSSSVYNKVQTTGAGDLIVTSNLGQMLKTDSVNYNVLLGQQAGGTTYEGQYSTFLGYQAGYLNTSGAGDRGKYNTYVGYQAGYGTTNNTGYNNSAIGYRALFSNTSGYGDSAMGLYSLYSNTTGVQNSAMGMNTLFYNKSGHYNTAVGYQAGYGVLNNSFSSNSLFGFNAGYALSTGSNNILIGYQAGDAITTGANNLIIGYNIDAPSATGSNQMSIGNLIFGTGIDGTGTTISTGNVGIGTSAPTAKLSVAGGIDSTGTISASDLQMTSTLITPRIIGGTATTSDLYFQTTSGVGTTGADMHFLVGNNGATEAMTILNSGYVGIGTTAPVSELHIAVADSDDVGTRFTNSTTGGTANDGFWVGLDLSEGAGLWQYENDYLRFGTNGTERMRIDNTGLVGIGTVTPTSILHTVASGAKTDDYIGNLLTNTATSSTASKTKTGLSVLSTGTWNGTTAVNRGLYINATGGTTNYSAIFEGGNVGIGTSTPSNALSVVGGIDSTTTVSAADLDATTLIRSPKLIGGTATTSDLYLQTTSGVGTTGADMHFLVGNNGGTEAMTILNSGYVGIGTTGPSQALEVAGSGKFSGTVGVNGTAPDASRGINMTMNGNTYGAYYSNTTGLYDQGIAVYTSGAVSGDGSFIWGAYNLMTVSGGTYAAGFGVDNSFTVSGNTASGFGVRSLISASGAGTAQDLFGEYIGITPDSAGDTAYGIFISDNSTGTINDPSADQAGLYINWGYAGTDANNKKWAFYNASDNTTSGKVFLGKDSTKTFWGTGYDASIYYDGTNFYINPQEVGSGSTIFSAGNVGIGTTTPTSILHTVASGAKTDDYIGNLLTNTATSSTASKTKTGLSVLSTGTWNGTTAVNRGLYVNATGGTTNYSAIFEGGNVGIGTSTPANALSVVGGITSTTTVSAADLDATTLIRSPKLIGGTATTSDLYLQTTSGVGTTGADMHFLVGSNGATEAMTILNSGYVGIGTAGPTARLDLGLSAGAPGNLALGSYGNLGVRYSTARLIVGNNAKAYEGTIDKTVVANTNAVVGYNFIELGYDAGQDGIKFHTLTGSVTAGATASSERMRITKDGNVGIGTATPTSILHTVASGAKTDDYIGNLLTNTATSSTASKTKTGLSVLSTGTWDGTTAVNRGLYINATGGTTNYSAIFEGGNVGIGTTTPSNALSVVGGINSTTTVSAADLDATTLIRSPKLIGGTATTSDLYLQTTSGVGATGADMHFLVGNNGGTEAMTILNSGYVGIGTTAPNVPLTVVADSSSGGGMRIWNNSNSIGATAILYFHAGPNIGSSTNYLSSIREDGNGGQAFAFTTYNGATSIGGERMRITGSGNVGIGTTTPTSILHTVASGAKTDDYIGNLLTNTATSSTASKTKTGLSVLSTGTWDGTTAVNRGLYINATGGTTNYSAIFEGGNVGIGTSTPSNALSVVGGIDSTTTVSAADLDATTSLRIGSSSVYNKVQTTGAGDLIVTSNLGQMLKTDSVNYNVLLGQQAGGTTYEGQYNTLLGYQAGYLNTSGAGDEGKYNTYVGYKAGYGTTNNTGKANSSMGYGALNKNTTGYWNSAMGYGALYSNTTGYSNSAMGYTALLYTKTGNFNTAVGFGAGGGVINNSFSGNSIFGSYAGNVLSTGSNNILIGYGAGDAITTGANNLIIGYNIDAPSATGSNQMSIGNLIFGTGIDGTGTTISTGNIGIGVTSPSAKLSVVGGITSTTTVSATNLEATADFYAPVIRGTVLTDGTISISGGNITSAGTIQLTGSGDDVYFFDGNASGENYELRIYGYITATTEASFAAMNLDDTNDEFLIDVADGDGSTTLDAAVRLDDTAGSSVFRVRDSAGTEVFYVDSDGIIKMYYNTSAPSLDANGEMAVAYVDGTNRIYFYSNGGIQHVNASAGFEIPAFETADPISGEPIEIGDFVVGMVNNTFSDGALHGIWTKWDNVKKGLIEEIKNELGIGNVGIGGLAGDLTGSSSADGFSYLTVTASEEVFVGDVVVADKEADSSGVIKKTNIPYDSALFGVVSNVSEVSSVPSVPAEEEPVVEVPAGEEPAGEVPSVPAEVQNQAKVLLWGRTEVKVNLENGPIRIGDYLTASSEPGAAMRADKAGTVIGMALEAYGFSNDQIPNPNDQLNPNPEGELSVPYGAGDQNPNDQIGKIMVFVNIGFRLGENGVFSEPPSDEIAGLLSDSDQGIVSDFVVKTKQALAGLGLAIENGVAAVKELVVDKLFAKQARIERLEMVDQKTGEVYCTWLEYGEWKKVRGECSTLSFGETETGNDQIPNPNDQTNPNDQNPNGEDDEMPADTGSLQTEIRGCTDPEALNYNAEANTDDGSCEYAEFTPEPEQPPPAPETQPAEDTDSPASDGTQ